MGEGGKPSEELIMHAVTDQMESDSPEVMYRCRMPFHIVKYSLHLSG